MATEDGDITVSAVKTAGGEGPAGANGGDVTLSASRTGSVTAGAIDAWGGNGTAGAGGNGGEVVISANAGAITVERIDTHGGNGALGGRGGNGGPITLVADLEDESVAPPGTFSRVITVNGSLSANGGTGSGDGDDVGAVGGTGGQIGLSAGLLAEGGSIVLGQSAPVQIEASGGSGTAGGGAVAGTSAAGAIRIEAYGDIDANADLTASGGDTTSGGPGGAGGNGGQISIASEAGNVSFAGSLESQGGTGIPGTDIAGDDGASGAAIVEGHGDVAVALGADTALARFEVVETEVTGAVAVSGAGITAQGAGASGSTFHTITNLVTADGAPHFTYRLSDAGDDPVDQIDTATLAVSGATFGTSGGTLANARADATQVEGERLLGRIQGTGAGPHVTTAGNLQIFATNLGDETPLSIVGSS
ncbi:MAG: hypothetical protein L0221_17565, partial [Chloroflexi bacterium]|nr:hypothetical protein [Chloroflexota bacterium]